VILAKLPEMKLDDRPKIIASCLSRPFLRFCSVQIGLPALNTYLAVVDKTQFRQAPRKRLGSLTSALWKIIVSFITPTYISSSSLRRQFSCDIGMVHMCHLT